MTSKFASHISPRHPERSEAARGYKKTVDKRFPPSVTEPQREVKDLGSTEQMLVQQEIRLAAARSQNGSGVINAIHYRFAATLRFATLRYALLRMTRKRGAVRQFEYKSRRFDLARA